MWASGWRHRSRAVRRSRDDRGERRSATRIRAELRLLRPVPDRPRGRAAAGRSRRDRLDGGSQWTFPARSRLLDAVGLLVQCRGYVCQIAEDTTIDKSSAADASERRSSVSMWARRCRTGQDQSPRKSTAAFTQIVAAARTMQRVDVGPAIERKVDRPMCRCEHRTMKRRTPFRSPQCTSSGSRSSIQHTPSTSSRSTAASIA